VLSRNLLISGTLGVLDLANAMGFLADSPQVPYKLRTSGFSLSELLQQQLLLRYRVRRGAG
jgi:predicted nucleic acid-binding protein